AGAGLDVVEPDVLDPGAVGPGLLARHRARVTPDALVQVHHHRHLRHHPHDATPSRADDALPAAWPRDVPVLVTSVTSTAPPGCVGGCRSSRRAGSPWDRGSCTRTTAARTRPRAASA